MPFLCAVSGLHPPSDFDCNGAMEDRPPGIRRSYGDVTWRGSAQRMETHVRGQSLIAAR
ncbi:hypothetical protein E1A91_D03G182600v1 [Gossypium mustelinum]|uniref:Uncharacterized protein n=2 Tax=Gossypium TaxID=3633 RepID=A0A5D2VPV8_GOSMU|nr:hypothetical protein ES332_D03G198800v1 [Gossypium tomentosum]TYI91305.1 hypothetical protein E1A91_D03G182600v1 [Gossypium mustelinum]